MNMNGRTKRDTKIKKVLQQQCFKAGVTEQSVPEIERKSAEIILPLNEYFCK